MAGEKSARGRWSRVICRGGQGPGWAGSLDPVGNFNFYLKSEGKLLENLSQGVT